VPISELVFGALTQNRSSLEPSLGFAAIAGTPRIENGGTFGLLDQFIRRRENRPWRSLWGRPKRRASSALRRLRLLVDFASWAGIG
jgi:hypothetical protein